MTRLLLLLLSVHLFAVSLLPGGNAHELTEMPTLWHHYEAHHADSSLTGFLAEHFLAAPYAQDTQETHGDEHQSLPWHHSHDTTAPAVYLPPVVGNWALVALTYRLGTSPRPTLLVLSARPGTARPCWQPPRA